MTTGTIGPGSFQPWGSYQNAIGSTFYRSWSGADDPGHLKENPYTSTVVHDFRAPCYYFRKTTPTTILKCGPWSNWGGYNFVNASISSNDELALLSKLLGKIKGHDFNLGVSLGEGRETLSMLKESGITLLRSITLLKRGRFQASWKTLLNYNKATKRVKPSIGPWADFLSKDLSGKWMAMRYGWRPAINDMYAALQAIESLRTRKQHTTERIHVSRSVNVSTVQYNAAQSYKSDCSATMHYIVKLKRDDQLVDYLSELGVLNLPALGYELLTMSFVLDWFIPIGTYLNTVNALPKIGATYIKTTVTKWSVYNLVGLSTHPTYFFVGGNGTRVTKVVTNRVVTNGVKVPLPRFKLPFAGGLARIADSFALLRSRIH